MGTVVCGWLNMVVSALPIEPRGVVAPPRTLLADAPPIVEPAPPPQVPEEGIKCG